MYFYAAMVSARILRLNFIGIRVAILSDITCLRRRTPMTLHARARTISIVFIAAVLLLQSTGHAQTAQNNQAQSSPFDWTPPKPRTNKTPFAPKPFAGNNIFKGEAETWLAETISKGFRGQVENKFLTDYVTRVGNHLAANSVAPNRAYKFVVIEDEDDDAMSVGGGFIYITTGMLKTVESEDELAGVLAHEIGHDAFGHTPKTITRQLFWMTGIKQVKTRADVEDALEKLFVEFARNYLEALGESLLGFSRFNELEADRAAFYNVYKAGYNPSAVNAFMKRMAQKDKRKLGKEYNRRQLLAFLFGSHPPRAQRITALSWESNFVKMPDKDARYQSSAFVRMKNCLADNGTRDGDAHSNESDQKSQKKRQ